MLLLSSVLGSKLAPSGSLWLLFSCGSRELSCYAPNELLGIEFASPLLLLLVALLELEISVVLLCSPELLL